MKTHPIILLSIITQSLCAQEIKSWVHSGYNDIQTGIPVVSVSRQWLSETQMTEQSWSMEAPRTLWLRIYRNQSMMFSASNQLVITWTNGLPGTNVQPGWLNGRWNSGGDTGFLAATNWGGEPYTMLAWSWIAVSWPTNTPSFIAHCPNGTDQAQGVLLYRTNGTTILLTALAAWTLEPGETKLVRVNPESGHYWHFMLPQWCVACDQQSCSLPWTVVQEPPSVSIQVVAGGESTLAVKSAPGLRMDHRPLSLTGIHAEEITVRPPTPEESFLELSR